MWELLSPTWAESSMEGSRRGSWIPKPARIVCEPWAMTTVRASRAILMRMRQGEERGALQVGIERKRECVVEPRHCYPLPRREKKCGGWCGRRRAPERKEAGVGNQEVGGPFPLPQLLQLPTVLPSLDILPSPPFPMSAAPSSSGRSKRLQLSEEEASDDLDGELAEARAKAAAKASLARLQAARKGHSQESVTQPRNLEEDDAESGWVDVRSVSTGQADADDAEEERLRRQNNGGEGSSSLSEHHAPVRIRPPRLPATRGPIPPRSAHPPITSCSSVSDYEKLNHIEEGTYGVVFRARHKVTGEIVALKKLKMDRETNGFPITSLREIRTLMMAQHENVVRVKEVVVGETLTQ